MHTLPNPMPSRLRRGIPLLGVVMAALASQVGCHHGGPSDAHPESLGVPVTVASAQERDIITVIDALGAVVPLQQAQIKVRVDGQILAMPAAEGEEVAAGALLAEIDPRPYRAVRMQQEALTAKDQALLTQANAELARYLLLAKSGMASQDSLEVAQTQAASLKATVIADRAAEDAARLQEDFTSVRAPFAGRIGLHAVDPGAVVHVTDAAGLFSISQMAPISVICSIPQDSLPALRQAVAASPGVQVEVSSRTHAPLTTGTVVAIDNHIDSATGQVQVRIVCTNTDRALWPGAFVAVQVPLSRLHGIAVPSAAVERSQEGWTVFEIGKVDGCAHLRPVEIGEASQGWTIIRNGLPPGAVVVTAGSYRLADGVRVDAHAPAPSPTTAP
jgi:multidrug efflux system membrane fusion protein